MEKLDKTEYEAPVAVITTIVDDIVLYSDDEQGFGPLIPLSLW